MDFKRFSELILIEQTFFTLPFAYLGILFAGGGTIKTWILTTIALAAARTSGMSFNRVIDFKIDKKNPEKERVYPGGIQASYCMVDCCHIRTCTDSSIIHA
jgi:4-hydroxybenzoate polyprenyltransferase